MRPKRIRTIAWIESIRRADKCVSLGFSYVVCSSCRLIRTSLQPSILSGGRHTHGGATLQLVSERRLSLAPLLWKNRNMLVRINPPEVSLAQRADLKSQQRSDQSIRA